MKKLCFGVLIGMISLIRLHAMEGVPSCYSIILPGQNGEGGGSYRFNKLVNAPSCTIYDTLYSLKVDLGQGNCVKDFLRQVEEDTKINEHKKIILHGISQGTATMIRSYKDLPDQVREKVACLTLEAVLGDANSAMLHTTKNLGSSYLLYIPLSRLWIPLMGKCLFPTYNPFAPQTYYYARFIPDEVPVIIMHDKDDKQLSINDARKLYCILSFQRKKCQNTKVYLIETCCGAHMDILNFDKKRKRKIKAIQQIYKDHELPYDQNILGGKAVDVKGFQPSIAEVLSKIKQTEQEEKVCNFIDSLTILGLTAYGLTYWNTSST